MGIEDTGRKPKKTMRVDEPTARISTLASSRAHVTLNVVAGNSAGALVVLERPSTTIGRDPANDVVLSDGGVSSRHAKISRSSGVFLLEDLQSTNGTFVNGARLDGVHPLADGDRIDLGQGSVLAVRFLDDTELEAAKRLYESVVRDPLTGVYNRRHFDERLLAEWAFASRHDTTVALVMVDVDHFKQVNDTFGHLGGDAALRVVGRTLGNLVRVEDVAARFGGEEFAVIARGIETAQALAFGERIRRAIESAVVEFEGIRIPITASVGVSVAGHGRVVPDPGALIGLADAALYRAKSEGRNRVCLG